MFLCVVDNRNFLIARKYSVFKQKEIVDFSNDQFGLKDFSLPFDTEKS